MDNVLEIKNLHIDVKKDDSTYNVVKDVNVSIGKQQIYGIVGESGSGKSLTALSIMGLLANPPLHVSKGSITFEGNRELLDMSFKEMKKIRGKEISMIFQEPMTALDPLFTIQDQLMEALKFHTKLSKSEMKQACMDIVERVGIPRPKEVLKDYPHQLSGGMRQRIMIAIAMLCNPKLLLADEPTTALDVTIQAQILDLMKELREDFETSILMITHDLGVIAETCQRVAVMYAGEVVEESDVVSLFHSPKHPYTKGLLKSMVSGNRHDDLYSIPGKVPSVDQMPSGCRFATRCPHVMDICHTQTPPVQEVETDHTCQCWLYQEELVKNG
ncbi:ATP-binding cassette domain-containing protein [Pontibacillus yanchengensis]|uniref:ATP-binding cassette domain-containing protein n=1 Tax=Pontibacillus yanchengensis TaxID=462910 RepID=A0ACC7VIE0_9BACI|nr:ABC transporter ATP-binding protein [Pontibacillus yanchengensis]MYL53941.1 ATP-binding cassette domain-containing protein [Pontibacillus yanchengensis]